MSEPKDILNDDEAMKAIRALRERGYSPNEVIAALKYDPPEKEQCPKCGLYVADKNDVATIVIEMKSEDGFRWPASSYACRSGRCIDIQIEKINKESVGVRAVGYEVFVPPA